MPDAGSTVMSSTARYTARDILDVEDIVRAQAFARVEDRSAVLTATQAAVVISVFEVAAGSELFSEPRAPGR
ncbi:hypothetical protein [Streptomyces liangshanensis]|uniref:hypothetical protein n=1 Tax=Streptomyces liangshanensis TaxID=2717324 RepID=UPI0036DC43A4